MHLTRNLIAGCVSLLAGLAPAMADGLAGSEWRPKSLTSQPIPATTKMSVQFKGAGKLAGHGGCNRFFGNYETDGNRVKVGPAGSTRMACEKSIMDAERALFAVLQSAATFRRDGTRLTLFDADGRELARLVRADWD